ncbi:SDR family oxidoreductase [Leptospira fluminis]|uniref:SDR family oxidoreductase n=1 Tax=Leptospira fluminis TaxID=2484979 RepID=A0A4R9GN59_9LEPT|nr:SDR family oxidoreductase [Leptospira fluminis]TGK17271.1 SDR family oxidoreductase [Leptospira fluminis]
MRRFEDFKLGEKASLEHTITQEDLDKFVGLTGDNNKLHVDSDFAAGTSFKKPVVHGWLGASFISTLIGTKLPGDGALWFSQTLDFLLPVRIEDRIKVEAEITQKEPREKFLVLDVKIFNQYGQTVTKGIAKVKIIEPALESASMENPVLERKRRAVIVGSTGGIGKETAKTLAEAGYDLILHYSKNREASEELTRSLRREFPLQNIFSVRATFNDANSIREFKNEISRYFDSIDVLVYSVSSKLVFVPFEQSNDEDFLRHLAANVTVPYWMAKEFYGFFDSRYSPCMVFISSMAADQPVNGWLGYSTSKAGMNALVKGLALELASVKIRVNAVSPAMTETDLISEVPSKARLLIEAKSLRGRLARPADVANAIAFLASQKSDYMTGEILRVTGGQFSI